MNTITPTSNNIVEFAEKITGVKLLPHQVKFLREVVSDHRKNYVIAAPRGSGKTWLAAIICAWYLIYAKNYRIVIAAGSRDQASRMMSYLHYFFSGVLAKYIKLKKHIGRYSIYIAENNNRLTLISSSFQSRRGEHSNLLIIDEAESIEEEILLDYLGIPTFDPSRILILSTPVWTKTFSIFKTLFMHGGDYGYETVRWSSEEAMEIPGWKQAYMREKLKAQTHPAWFRTQWEAEFVSEEGLVFKNLEACVVKTRPEPMENFPIRIGVDWGYTHRTVIIVSQLVGRYINILRSYSYQNVTFSAIVKHLLTIYAEFEKYTKDIAIISDASAMGAEKTAELRSYGLNVIGVPFTNEKMSHLIPNAVSWVENGAVRIYEGEQKLLQQLSGYYWESSESGKLKTKKIGDDFVDAFMLSIRDWRYLDILTTSEKTEDRPSPLVSVYNYPETVEFLKRLRGEDL